MRISQINYSEALKRINRISTPRSLESWFLAQGAKYLGSNEFVDASLRLTEDHFENVLRIIKSARMQGHHGVEIRLNDVSYAAIQGRIAEISALEDVDVDSQFYGEYLEREQITAVFRERKAEWLLERAKQNLPSDEYALLKAMVDTRLTRSEMEVVLTVKAIAT